MSFAAVVFDLGGVVLGSPIHAILDYERELGIDAGSVNRSIAGRGSSGAWQRLERGELRVGDAFFGALDAELRAQDLPIEARELMRRIAGAAAPRPRMLEAIATLRRSGFGVAALTNNWVHDDPEAAEDRKHRELAHHFDHFIESRAVGLRKPDPRIYHLACERLGVAPELVVFLDDIGANLKAARALGMTTIKVEDPETALAELEVLLEMSLR